MLALRRKGALRGRARSLLELEDDDLATLAVVSAVSAALFVNTDSRTRISVVTFLFFASSSLRSLRMRSSALVTFTSFARRLDLRLCDEDDGFADLGLRNRRDWIVSMTCSRLTWNAWTGDQGVLLLGNRFRLSMREVRELLLSCRFIFRFRRSGRLSRDLSDAAGKE